MNSRSVIARRLIGRALFVLVCLPIAQAWGQAGGDAAAKKPLTIDDYSSWRLIEDAEIAGNGRWVAYTLRYTNTLPQDSKPELHLRDLQSDQDVVIPNAHGGEFSPDSRWIVYQVDSVPPPRQSRGRGDTTSADSAAPSAPAAQDSTPGTALPPRVALRVLATGRTQAWEGMQSARFNRTSTHLLLLRRRPASAGRGRGSAAAQHGVDAVLHNLADGRSLFLGSVGDAAFNRQGDLLAYAVDAEVRDGNGLFVIDLPRGRTQVLDNDTLIYSRIEWSDDGTRLAALKGRPIEKMRERDNTLVTFANIRAALDRAPSAPVSLMRSAAGFPEGFVISERAPLAWTEDGRRVFFGIIPQTAAPDTSRRPSRDSVANVDVWRTEDERIQSVQMVQAERERNFTFRQAFDAVDGRYITLTDSALRFVEIAPDGRWAVGQNNRAYVADTAHAKADLYRINTATGERTLMLEGQLIGQHAFGISPDGRRFLYWRDNRFHAYDLDAGASRTVPGGGNGEFLNAEWDYVGPRPSYGIEGYASDGSGVIVRARYDLWLLPFGNGAPRNLTGGEGDRTEVRFRYVRTEPIDSAASRRVRTGNEIDLSKPVTLSAYGQWTKQEGFYRLTRGRLEELLLDDARFSTPVRADQADRFLLTRQTYAEFPDLQVSSSAFTDLRKISDANPQQAEFMWGNQILFDYENKDGVRLQGILALPDDYQPGQRRSMLVSFYEKNSQNLHRYPTPRFMTGMGALSVEALSRGYINMLADVHFHTGSSHSDMLECVEAATRKVIELGYADSAHIGVHGHSYGGEGAAFIGTMSRMFAAVGMGAGVTDISSDFNQSWGWSYDVNAGSGENGSEYYLFSQGRWGKSPWDDPDLYRFESAVAHAPEATAPFLIMHGTSDPTVSFSEGMNFYNALRYNGKTAIMLAYPEEGHGLSGLANRRDLTIRYYEFFDHYLKGEAAPKWMTDGVPYLVKESGRE
jgi:dipeptidyl aminopeptidase/acylaminoacyl peptidase